MESETPSGKTWVGFSCPACQTVFRVAAKSQDTDVVCPSCNQTLRLPKTTAPATESSYLREVPPNESPSDTSRVSKNRRIVAAMIMLIFVALAVTTISLNSKKAALAPTEISPPEPTQALIDEEPAPPPPPVAVKSATGVLPVSDPPTPPNGGTSGPPVSPTSTPTPIPPPAPTPPQPPPLVGEAELVDAIPANSPLPPNEIASPQDSQQQKVEPSPQPSNAKTIVHTVVRGDTLSRIARTYRVEQSAIQQANQMNGDVVHLGAQLVIPQP